MQPRKREFRRPSHDPNRQPASLPKYAVECRFMADALGRNLKRELARLDHGLVNGVDIKPVFDRAYMPQGASIADGLAQLGIAELEMLRLPLWPELASTQIRIVLQILSGVAKVLDAAGL